MKNVLISIIFLLIISGCSTVTSSVEGVLHGAKKDVSDVIHYSTCIFTDAQCFE